MIATLSFMSLFFFSRLLMIVSDILDEKLNNMQKGTWRTVKTVTKEVSARTIGRRGSADNDEKRLDEE